MVWCLIYTAEARLGPEDWIVVDAPSAADVLQQMRVVLAGTMGSRAVR